MWSLIKIQLNSTEIHNGSKVTKDLLRNNRKPTPQGLVSPQPLFFNTIIYVWGHIHQRLTGPHPLPKKPDYLPVWG